MKYYLYILKNYATFTGRARRKEYWMFALFNIIFAIIAMILDRLIGDTFTIMGRPSGYGYIYAAYSLALLIPGLAVFARRMHDVGKSGWYFFLALIPIIGWIWVFVLLCTDSQPEINKWGPNPKGDIMDIDQIGSNIA